MAWEPLSPELALVDPELGARARAALPDPIATPRPVRPATPIAAPSHTPSHRSPMWARVTAALWLLVLGILIGGAAIPHAQDKPRVIPKNEDATATICKPQQPKPTIPGNLPRGP